MSDSSQRRFRNYAWGVLAYNLGVIAWGAYVRATGSGAGCGEHWPMCNGEIVPRAASIQTLIEYSHRLTSGLALLSAVVLVIWAFRAFARGSPVRRGAAISMVLMLTEAAVGAGLVLFRLVADDQSAARALAMSVHLINTFLLIGSIALTAWWASGGRDFRFGDQGALGFALGAGLLGVIVLGVSGAITALGDTLFPAESLAHGIQQDFSPTSHFLLKLRVWHPALAGAVGTAIVFLAIGTAFRRPSGGVRRLATGLVALYVAQLAAGVVNLFLLAPVWMQLVHLLLADLVWINLVLLSAAAFGATQPATDAVARRSQPELEAARV